MRPLIERLLLRPLPFTCDCESGLCASWLPDEKGWGLFANFTRQDGLSDHDPNRNLSVKRHVLFFQQKFSTPACMTWQMGVQNMTRRFKTRQAPSRWTRSITCGFVENNGNNVACGEEFLTREISSSETSPFSRLHGSPPTLLSPTLFLPVCL